MLSDPALTQDRVSLAQSLAGELSEAQLTQRPADVLVAELTARAQAHDLAAVIADLLSSGRLEFTDVRFLVGHEALDRRMGDLRSEAAASKELRSIGEELDEAFFCYLIGLIARTPRARSASLGLWKRAITRQAGRLIDQRRLLA